MDPIDRTRHWLETAVIGLNLCPFAKAVHVGGRIRWVLSEAADAEALLDELVVELRRLHDADPDAIDTTLIVHPGALADFDDYNDFLDVADAAVDALGLEGELQVASFHPDYRYADSDADDPANLTNRSPYPMLHLLREASVERAIDAFGDTAAIVDRNVATLRRIGFDGWRERLAAGSGAADPESPR